MLFGHWKSPYLWELVFNGKPFVQKGVLILQYWAFEEIN